MLMERGKRIRSWREEKVALPCLVIRQVATLFRSRRPEMGRLAPGRHTDHAAAGPDLWRLRVSKLSSDWLRFGDVH